MKRPIAYGTTQVQKDFNNALHELDVTRFKLLKEFVASYDAQQVTASELLDLLRQHIGSKEGYAHI